MQGDCTHVIKMFFLVKTILDYDCYPVLECPEYNFSPCISFEYLSKHVVLYYYHNSKGNLLNLPPPSIPIIAKSCKFYMAEPRQ